MSEPGWGIVLEGHPYDLEDWQEALKPPFDPWVEGTPEGPALRSRALDALTSALDVHTEGEGIVEMLNGAFAISHRAQPLRANGVVEFVPDGQLRRHGFGIEVTIFERSKARGVAAALGLDAEPAPQPHPKPTKPQEWFAVAEGDEVLSDALIHFSRPPNWFDTYKALECLIIRFGKGEGKEKEKNFLRLKWEPSGEVAHLKRTANFARHSRHRFRPPRNPMRIDKARDILGRLIRRALEEAAGKP
jgi:hypothetical protein